MPGDPLSRPLIEIARELRDRRASARELVEAAIARHERFGERLHAYSFWAPDQARTVADAADAGFAAGASVGPLQGLPVSDGPLVATLRRQLGVIMGKTHMVEFAFGGTGQNSHHGAPYNPWDAAAHRSVGSSTSGAGVSLLERPERDGRDQLAGREQPPRCQAPAHARHRARSGDEYDHRHARLQHHGHAG
jgi:aspartyl-tRNA(Asn)/glutamyl-tRNA(Gln) amidotransferase subunit A